MRKSWKVYGPQESESYYLYLGDCRDDIESIEVFGRDKTRTDEYVIFRVTGENYEACAAEFIGQLYDGAFENSRVDRFEPCKCMYHKPKNLE